MKTRGKLEIVSIEDVSPNGYNYNEMANPMLNRERTSMNRFGVFRTVLVRETPKGPTRFEIIDGEHRWKGLKAEGSTQIPVRNLGKISDEEARALTILLDEIRGENDFERLSELFASITGVSAEDISAILPYSKEEIATMIDASKFEFPEYDYNRDEHGSGDTLEYIRILFRVMEEDAGRIQEKLAAICEEEGFSGKDDIRFGMAFEHLLIQRTNEG